MPFFVIHSEIKFKFEALYDDKYTTSEKYVTNIYIKRGKIERQDFDIGNKRYISDNFAVSFSDDSVILNLNKFGILLLIRKNIVIVDYISEYEHTVCNNLIELIMPYFFLKNGFLILHAASCRYNGKTLLFSADSGTGKTTLLLSFLKNGAEYISDDIVCVFKNGEQYRCVGLDFTFPKANTKTIEMLGIAESSITGTNGINGKSYISIGSNRRRIYTVDCVIFLGPKDIENSIELRDCAEPEKKLLEQTVGVWGVTGMDMIRLLSEWRHFSDTVNVYFMKYKKERAFLDEIMSYFRF